MRKYIYFLLYSLSTITLFAQLPKPARIIVRGDDMGYSHAGNLALIKCFKEGIQTSIEVIVPSPWFPEAVRLLIDNPTADVGVHLAITSEWDNVKWRPLTECTSIMNADGYFYPMVNPNKNYPGQSISENQWKIADIEKEFRAQIEMALKKIPQISHISSHMNCTDLTAEVSVMTRKLAKEYKIDIDLGDYGVEYVGYQGPHKTYEEKHKSFIGTILKLEPGKTYIFVDHPGLNDAELKAISHIGYEDVAADRQGVTDLFTSDEIKLLMKRPLVQLISYKDIRNFKQ